MTTGEKILTGLLILMALVFTLSGLNFYFNSEAAFSGLPSYYGVFNNHFVKDAGIAFTCSGIMLGLGAFNRRSRLIFVFCGSLFVVLHGLFHVSMLLKGMVPSEFYPLEFGGVIGPAFITLVLVLGAYKMRNDS